MPLYLYELILPDGSGGDTFEWLQSMSAKSLTQHPETGEPCRRIIGTPNTPRAWTDQQGKARTGDGNLERLGFTKYVKSGNGKYEKRFGKGPGHISKPPSE